jgi:hypothetical protein
MEIWFGSLLVELLLVELLLVVPLQASQLQLLEVEACGADHLPLAAGLA